MTRKLVELKDIKQGVILQAKHNNTLLALILSVGKGGDLTAMNLTKGTGDAFQIDAEMFVGCTYIVSRTEASQIMYDYHVRQHLDLAKKACDQADKKPKFKYNSVEDILAEMERLGRILNEKENDVETKAMLDNFDIRGNKKNQDKFISLTVQSIIDHEQFDRPLAEFLLAIQKPC